MRNKAIFILCLVSCMVISCANRRNNSSTEVLEPTAEQEDLLKNGWTQDVPESGDLSEEYGIKPIYGLQDNYFDICIGKGYNVAVKIVNAETNQPIRYVYVPEGEIITVNQIPQGMYYLKLAYGKDWMQCNEDSLLRGRFTRDAIYERSASVYDFGRKNSQSIVNYTLEINVIDGDAEHEFKTVAITEEEFEQN